MKKLQRVALSLTEIELILTSLRDQTSVSKRQIEVTDIPLRSKLIRAKLKLEPSQV